MATQNLTTVVDIQVKNSDAINALFKYNVALQEVAGELDNLKAKKREEGKLSEEQQKQVIMLTEKQKALKKEYAEMSRQVQNNIISEGKYKDTLKGMGAQLSVAKDTLRAMENGTLKYGKAVEEARAQLAKMEQGTAAYAKQEQAVKKLQRQMDSANEAYKKQEAYVKELNDTMKESEEAYGVFTRNVGNYKESAEMLKGELEGIRSGIDGLRGGLDTITQVMALTGTENEGLAKSIKVLTVGFTAFDSITKIVESSEKSSILTKITLNIQTKAQTLSTKLSTVATKANTVATKAATVAQKALNAVMKMSPLGLLTAGVVAAGAAIYGLSGRSKEATEETNKLTEAQEAQIEINRQITEGAGANIAAYERLRHEYGRLKSEKEKTDWINANTKAFDNLGIKVSNINEAERAFVENTSEMVESFRRRAEAAAYQSRMDELYASRLDKEIQKEKTVKAGDNATEFIMGLDLTRMFDWIDDNTVRYKEESGYHWTTRGAERWNKLNAETMDLEMAKIDEEIAILMGLMDSAEERIEEIEEETGLFTDSTTTATTTTTTATSSSKRESDKDKAKRKSAEERRKANEEVKDIEEQIREMAQKAFDEEIELSELRVAAAEEGSVAEWEARRTLLQQQYQEEIFMRAHTDEELELLKQKYHKDMEALDKEYADKQAEIAAETARREREEAENTAEIVTTTLRGIAGVFDQLAQKNEDYAKFAKKIALAQIAVDTGIALINGIKQAADTQWPANLAAISTTIGAVMSGVSQAISATESAKFARGGYVSGPGTATSDDIPARLSNGESVNTALTTSMFGPMLSAFNVMGGGVPIVAQTSAQMAGEQMLARAVARGVSQLRPVVSVSEINRVSNRVRVVSNLGDV